MPSVRVEIDEKVPEEVKVFISENEEAVAYEIEGRARGTTSFKDKSGKLRKSIAAKKSKYEGGGWIVMVTTPHAWIVEYGHDLIDWRTGKLIKHVEGRKYLRGALNGAISSAKTRFGVK